MELREAYHRGEAVDFGVQAERLKRQVSYHLRDRPMADADNWRLQNELGWHDDRGSLLRILDDPSIEPTNNRAERSASWGGDRAEGVTLLEERGGGRCVLGFPQRNQDVGAQWRRPICGGSALRSLQRRAASLTITPNLPRHALINYVCPIIGADHPRAKYGLVSIRYGKAPRDRSAITPKWSESSRPS